MGETVPVGYRFHPTDEELVGYFLRYKLLGDNSRVHNAIAEVDVCKYEPWDLPAFSKVKSDDPEWFFFSPRGLKYKNSKRSNRKTQAGYWKPTGNDRNIKIRGTNNVIGTKKTLVFYEGHHPNAVKTNWVIHEYQAVTFPDDKRTFVLCRLMKKAEKKAEGGTDAFIHDGGEPSNHIAGDYENLATVEGISDVDTLQGVNLESIFGRNQAEEYDLSSQLQSLIGQELYFQDSTFPNANFGNENSFMQFPVETTEEEDELFLNSILVDGDVLVSEERRHAFVSDSTPSESFRRVYYESSETDAELAYSQFGNIVDVTSLNERAGSSGCRIMKMVKTSPDTVYAGATPLSSKTELRQEKNNSSFEDDFWGGDTSGDSTANTSSIFLIESVSSLSPPRASSPSTSRRNRTKYHPKSDNIVSQRAAPRRPQTQRKVSSKAVSQHEVQKETPVLESNKDQRKAQGTRSRKNLETTSNQSSSVNGKGSFIHLETPSFSQNPSPRSVYLVNVVIGFSLLMVTIWDAVSYGKCC